MSYVMERDRVQLLDESWNVLAEVTFPEVERGVAEIRRTFVDESLRGQGVAGGAHAPRRDEHRRERVPCPAHVLVCRELV